MIGASLSDTQPVENPKTKSKNVCPLALRGIERVSKVRNLISNGNDAYVYYV